MGISDRDYMKDRYRARGGARSLPVWNDKRSRRELAQKPEPKRKKKASFPGLSGLTKARSSHHDFDEYDRIATRYRRRGRKSARAEISPDTTRLIILAMAIVAMVLAYEVLAPSHGSGGDEAAFPQTGVFQVKRAQASGQTGQFQVTAGDINAIVTLHGTRVEPVFMGFVRTRETADFRVPIGTWRVIVRETPVWDGTSNPDGITEDGPEKQSITVLPGSTNTMTLKTQFLPQ